MYNQWVYTIIILSKLLIVPALYFRKWQLSVTDTTFAHHCIVMLVTFKWWYHIYKVIVTKTQCESNYSGLAEPVTTAADRSVCCNNPSRAKAEYIWTDENEIFNIILMNENRRRLTEAWMWISDTENDLTTEPGQDSIPCDYSLLCLQLLPHILHPLQPCKLELWLQIWIVSSEAKAGIPQW